MQCADMYLTFEVNTSKVKSSHRIEMNYENKKARAAGLAESIMNQCVILYNNLQTVVKVDSSALGPNAMSCLQQFIVLALHITHFWLICAKTRC